MRMWLWLCHRGAGRERGAATGSARRHPGHPHAAVARRHVRPRRLRRMQGVCLMPVTIGEISNEVTVTGGAAAAGPTAAAAPAAAHQPSALELDRAHAVAAALCRAAARTAVEPRHGLQRGHDA
jgi:hypothetical protein